MNTLNSSLPNPQLVCENNHEINSMCFMFVSVLVRNVFDHMILIFAIVSFFQLIEVCKSLIENAEIVYEKVIPQVVLIIKG